MKNRIIIRALAVFSALTLCVCCLVSCDFNNPLRETVAQPKQLVGVENLTEEEIKTANMINERIQRYYSLYAGKIDLPNSEEECVERLKDSFYAAPSALNEGLKIGLTQDWLTFFKIMVDTVSFMAAGYEELSCVSIVVRGDTAEAIVRVLFNDKTEEYHKTELVFLNEEWFLTSVPAIVDYTPAS